MKFTLLLAMLLSPALGYAPVGVNRRAALLSLGKGSMGAAILGASAGAANAGSLLDLQNSGELKTIEEKEIARGPGPTTRMEKNKAAKAEAAKQAAIEAAKAGKSAGFNPRAKKAPAQF